VYRLQVRPGFGFAEVEGVLDHLAWLGVSHLYLSPILEAASDHGYDVVDHSRVRGDLGGEAGFRSLVAAARRHGLGLLVDIVPNHMAIGAGGAGNAWWWDVLEHGRASPYAEAFDIDWEAQPVPGQLLVPMLDDHLRRVIGAGRLQIARADDGGLHLCFEAQRYPLSPSSTAPILRRAAARGGDLVLGVLAERLEAIAGEEAAGRDVDRHEVDRTARAARAHIAAAEILAKTVDDVVDEVNADHAALERVVRAQHYRLARWSIANRELGYRRFFDVTDLVALRTETEPVFDMTHAATVELVRSGAIDGLRVDHPDGLRDPEAYLARLAERTGGVPVWVEKILGPGEALRSSWETEGTTGYDFLDLVNRVQLDTEGALALRRWFVAQAAAPADFAAEARAGKRLALTELLAADVDRVAAVAACVLEARGWDVSRREMRAALVELAVSLPVYRTYVRPGEPADAIDRHLLCSARDDVAARRPDLDRDVVGALVDAMVGPDDEDSADLAARFQQLTSPATAKGVEDTACYRWGPVASLCEVGSHPDAVGVDAEGFHAAVVDAARLHPYRILETSTHDTKRAEDVRARIGVLTEMPDEWIGVVGRLRALAEPHRGTGRDGGPVAIDMALELLALQTVVGAWPIDGDRFWGWLQKAAREAKRCTSWVEPDEAYEASLERWGRALCDDPALRAELGAVVDLVRWPGRVASLAQVVLKLTCPGVAGIYQGTELWDGSLVDPDNRRPVDFDERRALAADLAGAEGVALRAAEESGGLKQEVVRRTLDLRRRRPDALDGTARYEPLHARGAGAGHVVAFVRGGEVVVLVPRLPLTLERAGGWRDTMITVPPGTWRDVISGRDGLAGTVTLASLLEPLPVAVLERA
jgi:(1->4)-alpha-D-glucan 1-alpha-D-glucosylmutase